MHRRPLARTGADDALELARDTLRRAWGAVRSSPGLALLSLVLGVAIWLAVSDLENPTRVEVFPAAIAVEPVNLDPSLAVASTFPRVEVTISAPENQWSRLTSDNLSAFVDLNGVTMQEQIVPVQVDVRGIAGVRVTRVNPSSVAVTLEPQATRTVSVVPSLRGSVPVGYEVTQSIPAQSNVQVSGPSSLVALVKEVTAEVPVSGLTVDLVETAALTARSEQGGEIRGVRIEPASMRVQVKIVQSTLRRQIPLQATFSGEPATGYRIASISVSPTSMTIDGPIEVLQGLDAISLPAIDVVNARAPITRTIRVTPPAGATSPAPVDAVVTVDIQSIGATSSITVPLRVVGGTPSTRAAESAVQVQLSGPLGALNALSPADVRATLDVTTSEPGTYQLPVRVVAPAGIDVLTVQPATVSVTIPGPTP